MKSLGKRLRELRGDLSLYEVGKETDINRGHIQQYEEGTLEPTVHKLEVLAKYYEAYDELFALYLESLFPSEEQRRAVIRWAENLKGSMSS